MKKPLRRRANGYSYSGSAVYYYGGGGGYYGGGGGYYSNASLYLSGDATVQNTTIEYSGNDGIDIVSSNPQNVLVEDSLVQHGNGNGITISTTGQLTIHHNTIQDVYYNGISVYSINATITNNTIQHTGNYNSGSAL